MWEDLVLFAASACSAGRRRRLGDGRSSPQVTPRRQPARPVSLPEPIGFSNGGYRRRRPCGHPGSITNSLKRTAEESHNDDALPAILLMALRDRSRTVPAAHTRPEEPL
jgi:hypothetical protein